MAAIMVCKAPAAAAAAAAAAPTEDGSALAPTFLLAPAPAATVAASCFSSRVERLCSIVREDGPSARGTALDKLSVAVETGALGAVS